MDAVQVVKNLLVEGSQFIVQPNDPVKSAFVTFRSMWAAAAILALVKLQFSHIGCPLPVPSVGKEILCRLDKPVVLLHLLGNSLHGMDRHGISCPWFPFRTWGTSCIFPFHALGSTDNYSDCHNLRLPQDIWDICGIFS